MSTSEIEARLTLLETEVARLKQQLPLSEQQSPWWEKILGTFADDPTYDEAMRLGQQYRQSLCSTEEAPLSLSARSGQDKPLEGTGDDR